MSNNPISSNIVDSFYVYTTDMSDYFSVLIVNIKYKYIFVTISDDRAIVISLFINE